MRVIGQLIDDAGSPLVGWVVRAEDERQWKYSFAAVETGDDGRFVLESSTTPPRGLETELTFYVSDGDRPVRVLELSLEWGLRDVADVVLTVSAPPPPVFYLYGRVWNAATGGGVGGLTVEALDRNGAFDPQSAETGQAGLFEVWWPYKDGSQPDPEVRVLRGDAPVPSHTPPVTWAENHAQTVQVQLVWDVSGVVVDRSTGERVPGAVVEAWDAVDVWLASTHTDAAGKFTLHVPRRSGELAPPQPIFRVYRHGQPAGTINVPVPWDEAGFAQVELGIGTGGEASPTTYSIAGTAIDRATRRGAAALRVEAWNADWTFMLAVAETAEDGRFAVTLQSAAGEGPPQPRFRFYRGGQLVAQPDVPLLWNGAQATAFVEVDVPSEPPRSFRIAGRVIDKTARSGLPGLRVEAWDKAPRDGGALGVAAVTGSDGTFELLLPGQSEVTDAPGLARPRPPLEILPRATLDVPPRPMERFAPDLVRRWPTPVDGVVAPAIFIRVYGQERLLTTMKPEISWTPEGIGTTVIEMAAPAATSQEVGLHELGESVASTVDRVQTELARYPKTMGAYVLDEIDLNVPVEMRVDEVGQVRTKVVDAATPEKNVGQVRMKVRPVIGAAQPVTEVRDQPLVVLDDLTPDAATPEKNVGQVRMKVRPVIGAAQPVTEVRDQPLAVLDDLTPDAVARLEAQRIYSVEDLARAASSAAGRAAIEALDLGVDLDALLAKAALLAFRPLPRAIREALIRLGVTSLAAFSKDANPGALASQLSALLEQTFSESDVSAWQATVKGALKVPRPSDETRAPDETEGSDE